MVDLQCTVDSNRIKRTVEVRALFNLVIVPPSGVYEQASISSSRNGTLKQITVSFDQNAPLDHALYYSYGYLLSFSYQIKSINKD